MQINIAGFSIKEYARGFCTLVASVSLKPKLVAVNPLKICDDKVDCKQCCYKRIYKRSALKRV